MSLTDQSRSNQPSQLSRHDFRKLIRNKRNSLSELDQKAASQALVDQFKQTPEANAKHIALYLAADGELDTQPLIDWLWANGKKTYLPVIHPFSKGHLLFLEYTPNTEMTVQPLQHSRTTFKTATDLVPCSNWMSSAHL